MDPFRPWGTLRRLQEHFLGRRRGFWLPPYPAVSSIYVGNRPHSSRVLGLEQMCHREQYGALPFVQVSHLQATPERFEERHPFRPSPLSFQPESGQAHWMFLKIVVP